MGSFLVIEDSYRMGSQTALDFVLVHRGRLRDLHTLYDLNNTNGGLIVPDIIISCILGSLMAGFLNATLITHDHPSASLENLPEFMSQIEVFGGLTSTSQIWDKYYSNRQLHTELPKLIQLASQYHNFAYCSVSQKRWESSWNFSVFTQPFHSYTWVTLCSLLLAISLTISLVSRKYFAMVFLSALAVLLNNEMTQIGNSKLFVLWLLLSVLFVNLYSGKINSHIIAPPEEVTFTSLTDLLENNYTFIFPGYLTEMGMKFKVSKLAAAEFVTKDVQVVAAMLKTSQSFDFKSMDFVNALT